MLYWLNIHSFIFASHHNGDANTVTRLPQWHVIPYSNSTKTFVLCPYIFQIKMLHPSDQFLEHQQSQFSAYFPSPNYNRTGCPERLWMPHPWRHSRPGWMGPWAAWSSIKCGGWWPCLWWAGLELHDH